ncbi:YggT family protein [Gilvimarinus xylanilyticus]|uniref:YggT family protein n=1 Tax=Gilvimarinus xylanilyticus TaxID=2944139 RepID=A0A9X2KU36_9GAMM|nr:YggT family protein [Gilvimarinus xylanilyticus]MCP8899939.1 YggT family protein [Gilvimarinus xylanilyticus]
MNAMQEMLIYLIRTLGSLYMLIILLRFLLQLVRADFYNPISQGISKATNPLLLPLRRVIPGFYGIDLASLVLALLLQWVAGQLIYLVAGGGLLNPLIILPMGVVGILKMLVQIYFIGMIIYIIASWVAPFSHNPALVLLRQLIEPVMAPIRKVIPPLGPIDLSPIFLFLFLNLCNQFLIPAIAQALGAQGILLGF